MSEELKPTDTPAVELKACPDGERLVETLTFIADTPDPGAEKERSAQFYRIHIAMLKQTAAKALGRETVSPEAFAWAEAWINSEEGRAELAAPMNMRPLADLLRRPAQAEPALVEDGLVEAVSQMAADHMTSESHHPGYVLVPTAAFEAACAALRNQPAEQARAIEHGHTLDAEDGGYPGPRGDGLVGASRLRCYGLATLTPDATRDAEIERLRGALDRIGDKALVSAVHHGEESYGPATRLFSEIAATAHTALKGAEQ